VGNYSVLLCIECKWILYFTFNDRTKSWTITCYRQSFSLHTITFINDLTLDDNFHQWSHTWRQLSSMVSHLTTISIKLVHRKLSRSSHYIHLRYLIYIFWSYNWWWFFYRSWNFLYFTFNDRTKSWTITCYRQSFSLHTYHTFKVLNLIHRPFANDL
jgi:hypothetical protein